MAELCILAQEPVWFDQGKFEEAEANYQEILAQRHAGLRVEGTAVLTAAASALSNTIQEARSLIEHSLKTPVAKSNMEQRVKQLEKENKDLKAALAAAQSRVRELEARLGVQGGEQVTEAQQAEEDDDFDLFGSGDELFHQQEDAEAEKLKQQRVEQYHEKKSQKKPVVAKSSIVLEVKPWDDETDVKEIERLVRTITADGLLWGASKFVPVAYGIKKLQINCIVEDDKIGTDFLEETITGFEDLVQSMDIVAFNKI